MRPIEQSAFHSLTHLSGHYIVINKTMTRRVNYHHSPPPAYEIQPRPNCSRCGAGYPDLSIRTTSQSNRNGNPGRRYAKCLPCDKFVTWLDNRGLNNPGSPRCHCNEVCRMQRARNSPLVTTPGGLHYVCPTGACGYYSPCQNEQGRTWVVHDDLLDLFVGLRII